MPNVSREIILHVYIRLAGSVRISSDKLYCGHRCIEIQISARLDIILGHLQYFKLSRSRGIYLKRALRCISIPKVSEHGELTTYYLKRKRTVDNYIALVNYIALYGDSVVRVI